jgi:Calcineurin-like phosphoesterase
MKILVIPDCQVKEGVPLDHLTWAGKAIVEYQPDVVVNIGDFADMSSLSTHDKVGSKYFEGLRYKTDVDVTKKAMAMLLQPLRDLQAKQKRNKEKAYKPRMVFCLGNHEHRITRAVNNNPTLEGLISTADLQYERDWEVHDFLRPVFINNVGFNHYWPTGAMGRPASSPNAIISKLHMSCVAGHQQGKQVGYGKRADGQPICAIIAGSYYLHDESYMDQLSNRHWRGLVVLNEVKDGHFDEMFLSIEYLGKKYGS